MIAQGIGTHTKEQALASLSNMTDDLTPIQPQEHLERIKKLKYTCNKMVLTPYI